MKNDTVVIRTVGEAEIRAGSVSDGCFLKSAKRAGSVSDGCRSVSLLYLAGSIFQAVIAIVDGFRRSRFRLVDGFRRSRFRLVGGGFVTCLGAWNSGAIRVLAFLLPMLSSSHALAQQGAKHPDGILAREDPVIEPVGLADWPNLDRALKRRAPDTGRIVSFRELWQADPGLKDEPLIISGVVFRRFRTEPRGQFPSLEELWIRTDDDGLAVVTNIVPPKDEKAGIDRTEPGSPVRLVAWFLRKIRYEAEDEPRIAPWLASAGFEKTSESAGGSSTGLPAQADDKFVFFVILGVIAAITLLRVMLLWSDRSRRRTEAWRAAVRQNANSGNDSGRPQP